MDAQAGKWTLKVKNGHPSIKMDVQDEKMDAQTEKKNERSSWKMDAYV